MRVWSSFLNGTQAVFYIDNNSARMLPYPQMAVRPWPPSNCADAPSRNHTLFLELSGVDRSEVVGLVGDLISGLGSHIRNQSDKEGVSKAL